MREETRRKLEEMERDHRRSIVVAIVAALAMAIAAGSVYFLHNARQTTATVQGTVRFAVLRNDDDTGSRYADIQVMLDDGRLVNVATPIFRPLPLLGEHVVLEQRRSGLGLVSYRLKP